jgi:hypothetical protein
MGLKKVKEVEKRNGKQEGVISIFRKEGMKEAEVQEES